MTVTPQELAETMKRRARVRSAEFRAKAENLRAEVQRWASERVSAGSVSRVWLIGSLATGVWGEASDVDVVVEGASSELEGRLWDELSQRLGVQVDLLRVEDLPTSFAATVRATGIVLA